MTITFSQHSIQQMFIRNISVEQVEKAILYGKIIKDYPDDKPYPSKLLLFFDNELPLHVVIADNFSINEYIVITAYIPDLAIWHKDFKTKR
jgi:hypothetical protein